MRQSQVLSWVRVAPRFTKQSNSPRASVPDIENPCWEEGNVSGVALMCLVATPNPFSQHLDVCRAASIRKFREAHLNIR
jgi:hypothetical protein